MEQRVIEEMEINENPEERREEESAEPLTSEQDQAEDEEDEIEGEEEGEEEDDGEEEDEGEGEEGEASPDESRQEKDPYALDFVEGADGELDATVRSELIAREMEALEEKNRRLEEEIAAREREKQKAALQKGLAGKIDSFDIEEQLEYLPEDKREQLKEIINASRELLKEQQEKEERERHAEREKLFASYVAAIKSYKLKDEKLLMKNYGRKLPGKRQVDLIDSIKDPKKAAQVTLALAQNPKTLDILAATETDADFYMTLGKITARLNVKRAPATKQEKKLAPKARSAEPLGRDKKEERLLREAERTGNCIPYLEYQFNKSK